MDSRIVNHGGNGYSAPSLTVLGSVHRHTLTPKVAGLSDGVFLLGVGPIRNASV